MSTPALERFLASIYVDADARTRFLADAYGEARRAGLSEEQCRAMESIDHVGLEMAARSFSRKRAAKQVQKKLSVWGGILSRWPIFNRPGQARKL